VRIHHPSHPTIREQTWHTLPQILCQLDDCLTIRRAEEEAEWFRKAYSQL